MRGDDRATEDPEAPGSAFQQHLDALQRITRSSFAQALERSQGVRRITQPLSSIDLNAHWGRAYQDTIRGTFGSQFLSTVEQNRQALQRMAGPLSMASAQLRTIERNQDVIRRMTAAPALTALRGEPGGVWQARGVRGCIVRACWLDAARTC